MTDEDKKLILEWRGYHYTEPCWVDDTNNLIIYDDHPFDLNFYFKYAYHLIPDNQKFDFLYCWIVEIVNDKDPAEAFGQALLKLIRK